MQKVKVQRYISGKKPEYAQYGSSDEESGDESFVDRKAQRSFANRGDEIVMDVSRRRAHGDDDDNDEAEHEELDTDVDDPRLRRLLEARRLDDEEDDRDRLERRRHIHEPELLESDGNEDEQLSNDEPMDEMISQSISRSRRIALDSDSESETELSDSEIEVRRQKLRQKMMQQRKEEEVLLKEEEKSESSDSESSEYEEESESEEENEPRLKPLFVRKRDRATIAEKEKEAQRQKQLDYEAKRLAKEKRRQTLRLVEESVKKDLEKAKVSNAKSKFSSVLTISSFLISFSRIPMKRI